MAKNKAGGNSRKIGRNQNKPWKKTYDMLNVCGRNKRLRAERIDRQRAKKLRHWLKRIKARRPLRGHARNLRRANVRVRGSLASVQ